MYDSFNFESSTDLAISSNSIVSNVLTPPFFLKKNRKMMFNFEKTLYLFRIKVTFNKNFKIVTNKRIKDNLLNSGMFI